jgi:hypothetical protein
VRVLLYYAIRKHYALPNEPAHYVPTCNIFSSVVSLGLYSPCGPWLLFQSVGHLERGISPSQGRYLHREQHKHRYPCLECDSNPRSQCSNGRRRFIPYTARPLRSAEVYRHCAQAQTVRLFLRITVATQADVAFPSQQELPV